MIIKLVWSGPSLAELKNLVEKSLAELALTDSVKLETTDDAAYKMELGITETPALAIEEESIDFRDMIFQGEVPAYDEIKSMFISILGDDDAHSEGGCGSCSTGGCGTCGDWEDEGDSCGTGCHTH